MVATREIEAYRQDARTKHRLFTPKQREEILKPHLPQAPKAQTTAHIPLQPIMGFLKYQFHLLVYTIIHLVFSIYIRTRQTYHIIFDRVLAILYYHHRAPELIRQDIKGLTRIPEHLSVILELKGEDKGQAGLEALMDEVAEISAWCTCVGIHMLSVYEKTGMLLVRKVLWRSWSDKL